MPPSDIPGRNCRRSCFHEAAGVRSPGVTENDLIDFTPGAEKQAPSRFFSHYSMGSPSPPSLYKNDLMRGRSTCRLNDRANWSGSGADRTRVISCRRRHSPMMTLTPLPEACALADGGAA